MVFQIHNEFIQGIKINVVFKYLINFLKIGKKIVL